MIAFKVRLNYQLLAVAGAEDVNALSAHITAAIHGGPPEQLSCWLQVGGLSRDDADRQGEHRTWVSRRTLGVGDFVSLEIVETDEASPIAERRSEEDSPGIEEAEEVMTLLSQEFLLLLQASKDEGIDLNGDDRSVASRAAKLSELGLLVQRDGKLFASALGFDFLDHREIAREAVVRYRAPKK